MLSQLANMNNPEFGPLNKVFLFISIDTFLVFENIFFKKKTRKEGYSYRTHDKNGFFRMMGLFRVITSICPVYYTNVSKSLCNAVRGVEDEKTEEMRQSQLDKQNIFGEMIYKKIFDTKLNTYVYHPHPHLDVITWQLTCDQRHIIIIIIRKFVFTSKCARFCKRLLDKEDEKYWNAIFDSVVSFPSKKQREKENKMFRLREKAEKKRDFELYGNELDHEVKNELEAMGERMGFTDKVHLIDEDMGYCVYMGRRSGKTTILEVLLNIFNAVLPPSTILFFFDWYQMREFKDIALKLKNRRIHIKSPKVKHLRNAKHFGKKKERDVIFLLDSSTFSFHERNFFFRMQKSRAVFYVSMQDFK